MSIPRNSVQVWSTRPDPRRSTRGLWSPSGNVPAPGWCGHSAGRDEGQTVEGCGGSVDVVLLAPWIIDLFPSDKVDQNARVYNVHQLKITNHTTSDTLSNTPTTHDSDIILVLLAYCSLLLVGLPFLSEQFTNCAKQRGPGDCSRPVGSIVHQLVRGSWRSILKIKNDSEESLHWTTYPFYIISVAA